MPSFVVGGSEDVQSPGILNTTLLHHRDGTIAHLYGSHVVTVLLESDGVGPGARTDVQDPATGEAESLPLHHGHLPHIPEEV